MDTSSPIIAFDLGGTRIKAGVVTPRSGEVLALEISPTPAKIDDAIDAMRSIASAMSERWDLQGCGLCVPGLVDDDGKVVDLPGKLDGIVGMDLAAQLADIAPGRPVVVNDAVAYGLGEAIHGAGRGLSRVVVMTIGTGVGVTVIEDGRPLGGGPMGAGILGGMIPISESEEFRDSGGNPGSIEALCCATRIVDRCRQSGGEYTSVEEVFAASERKEEAAIQGLARYRGDLVRALAALAHAHAPDAIVLGGGPMTPGDPITPGMEEELANRTWGNLRVQVRVAALGDAAALAGLGHIVADRASSTP